MTVKSGPTIALLRFISKYDVHVDFMRECDNVYLAPLLRNGLVIQSGKYLRATQEGEEVLAAYNSSSPRKRKHVKEISNSCLEYLRFYQKRRSA